MSELTDIFQDCKYLYLGRVGEMADGTLQLIVMEAVDGGPADTSKLGLDSIPALTEILAKARAIEHLPGCRTFDIRWPSYIGYSIVNESYALGEPETSVGTGKLFREYTQSDYLDYLDYMRKASWASDRHPGPYKHWAAYCLNHVIDIASPSEPKIVVTITKS